MLEVKFYNSYTNKKEVFKPENPNAVKIYSCGPTVYNFNHIGNFRSYIFTDVLRRSLKLLGYKLDQTMNITDIEDKIITESIKQNVSVEEFTKKWIQVFFEDLQTLNIEKLSPESLSGLFMLFELVVATIAEYLDIDAFDQPGVEVGKKFALEMLKR
jgi:cysteinyl-tRNA synthetase